MKKLTLLLLFVCSGVFAQTDVKFTAKIANLDANGIKIVGPGHFEKEIKINKDGVYSDTFAAPAGIYQLNAGEEYTMLYFKPGYDLALTMDVRQFDESIVYKGKGERENNFLAKKVLMEEEFQNKIPTLKSQAEFDAAMADYHKKLSEKLDSDKGLDPDFKTTVAGMIKQEKDEVAAAAEQTKQAEALKEKLTGKASPTFDYENFKGGKTKLEDLRGKYVYIDVWAQWCGPCRAEIPSLQKIEEKYKGKNIAFVSISVDTQKDYEKWKKMVGDKNLGGIQLLADNNWNSAFITAYGINSIPRFILLDPKGNIVDADAKRPSNDQLQVQLDGLLK